MHKMRANSKPSLDGRWKTVALNSFIIVYRRRTDACAPVFSMMPIENGISFHIKCIIIFDLLFSRCSWRAPSVAGPVRAEIDGPLFGNLVKCSHKNRNAVWRLDQWLCYYSHFSIHFDIRNLLFPCGMSRVYILWLLCFFFGSLNFFPPDHHSLANVNSRQFGTDGQWSEVAVEFSRIFVASGVGDETASESDAAASTALNQWLFVEHWFSASSTRRTRFAFGCPHSVISLRTSYLFV